MKISVKLILLFIHPNLFEWFSSIVDIIPSSQINF